MANIFLNASHHKFTWDKLGDIKAGREDLGIDMPVLVYRLLEYTMTHVLTEEYGAQTADELLRKSGYLAGTEFAKNVLPLDSDKNTFIQVLQKSLIEWKMGILRMEQFDAETGEFTLTVAQDLDCSGLPPTDEVVCCYDEGFLAGVFEVYTGKPYCVREINCWASGDRICRFHGERKQEASRGVKYHG